MMPKSLSKHEWRVRFQLSVKPRLFLVGLVLLGFAAGLWVGSCFVGPDFDYEGGKALLIRRMKDEGVWPQNEDQQKESLAWGLKGAWRTRDSLRLVQMRRVRQGLTSGCACYTKMEGCAERTNG